MSTVRELGFPPPVPDDVDTSDIAYAMCQIFNLDEDQAWSIIENVLGYGSTATFEDVSYYDEARAKALEMQAGRLADDRGGGRMKRCRPHRRDRHLGLVPDGRRRLSGAWRRGRRLMGQWRIRAQAAATTDPVGAVGDLWHRPGHVARDAIVGRRSPLPRRGHHGRLRAVLAALTVDDGKVTKPRSAKFRAGQKGRTMCVFTTAVFVVAAPTVKPPTVPRKRFHLRRLVDPTPFPLIRTFGRP